MTCPKDFFFVFQIAFGAFSDTYIFPERFSYFRLFLVHSQVPKNVRM